MRVDIQRNPTQPSYYTVVPHGSIDSASYLEFQEKVVPYLTQATKGLLLDLQKVDYISSAGLGVLFTIKKHLQSNGGELFFCNLKPQIRRLFEIVKALPRESLFQSVEEADQYFYKIMNEEINKQKKEE